MEHQSKLIAGLARAHDEVGGRLASNAEFSLKRNGRVLRRNRYANKQLEIFRAVSFLDDFLEFILAVEGETLDAELVIRAADRSARFDRVHEMQRCAGNCRRVLKFRQRSDVKLTDAGAVQRAKQKNRAVSLIGVGNLTRKIGEKPTRCAPRSLGANTQNWIIRLTLLDQRQCRSKPLHCIQPPPAASSATQTWSDRGTGQRCKDA